MIEEIEYKLQNPLVRNIVSGITISITIITVVLAIVSLFFAFVEHWLWVVGFVFNTIICGVSGGIAVYLFDLY